MPLWWFIAVLGVLLEHPMNSGALNYQHMLEIFEENCSTALGIPIERFSQSFEKTEQDTHPECPPWWYRDRGDSDGTCVPGPNLNFIGRNKATMQTLLLQCTCMTEEDGILTVGGCLYTCIALQGIFPLPCQTSKLNNFTCEDLYRKGRLCGECKEDYAPPIYSYSSKCVKCENYHYNWIKYLCVAFLPLTLFFLIITIFSISFTSPQLSAVVIVYQEMVNPMQLDILVTLSDSGLLLLLNKTAANILISLAGIWNLDFFRVAYAPFCLHPSMTTLHTQAMDYAIAIYPLFLIMVTYIMVTLYDRGIKLVKCVWRPILKFLRKWKQHWDIRTSLIDVFASFIFLSATRLLSASFILLVPSYSYSLNSINASQVDVTHYVFNAPNVVYFSWGHLPFAITAITLLFLNLLPMILLFVYPLKSFQCLLNKLNLNSNSLRTFIDVFQGSFKDGTNGTRDYRFFSGFLLLIKFMFCATFWMTRRNVYYSVASVCILVYCSLVASCKPYKKMRDNYITIVMLATFLCYNAGIAFNIILNQTVHPLLHKTSPGFDALYSIAILLIGIGVATPTLYLIGRVAVLTFMLVKNNRCV